ncbi:aldo/keto reductase [Niabella drilacis]|uniref:Methylglyoxal reductase n=1 Tax=Niabella drilacis (strain DSM 25811 / CCM 8410 / CCUG 62505 / LMG 26954 / E90) TaxID=1285928 RepID=A0A1G6R365_NIADE|nr:aldo/keto reductase [Niabella drilacis]SDC99089.1 methylglyoxal reductase [Niabella drilacis]
MNEQGNTPFFLQQYVLGTAGLGGVWGAVDPEASVHTVIHALEAGISAIDTAPAYGNGEQIVGEALRQWKGTRPRISTKVGRLKSYASDHGIYDYTPGAMVKSVEGSLEILGIPAIDVLFLHEPAAIPEPEIGPAIAKMMDFKREGYARKIGLGGNYPPSFLKYLEAGMFDVVMEYNRLNACCTDALDTTLPECCSRNIAYWAASPLHMGLLGRCFNAFAAARPEWLEQRYIDTASGIHQMAVEHHLQLPSLALRFLQSIPLPVNIVIGPASQKELGDSLTAIARGPLAEDLYHKIIHYTKNI